MDQAATRAAAMSPRPDIRQNRETPPKSLISKVAWRFTERFISVSCGPG